MATLFLSSALSNVSLTMVTVTEDSIRSLSENDGEIIVDF
jgi:hypothetical protein